MKRKASRWILRPLLVTLLLLGLAACGQGAAPPPPVQPTAPPLPTATSLPEAEPALATVPPEPTAEPTPAPAEAAATPTASAEGAAASSDEQPALSLFDVAWEDRAPFRAGLQPDEQGVLDDLPGASVYHLDVRLDDSLTRLEGREVVRYTNQEMEPLEEIVFRLYPNLLGGRSTVENVTVNGAPVEGRYELERSALRVPLPEPLAPGEAVVLALDFEVEVPESAEGNYGSFTYLEDVLALAHFYPIIAAYDADQGWDVEIPAESGDLIYADSSFYLVRVTAPSEVTLVASGVVVEREVADGLQTVTYAAGPMRDFYLAGSPDYEQVSETVDGVTVNSYYLEGFEAEGALVLQNAVDAIRIFDERIGPYPYSEFDLIATPNLALGIEYPGIVAITQRLYDDLEGPDQGAPVSVILESTVAHEVAHQWFYGVVGNDQLDDPWLDESLVQYVTYLYFVDLYGPSTAQGFYDSLTGRWDRISDQPIPIGLPVKDYTPIEYGAIVYGRGPLFFEALAEALGPDAFDDFLSRYYLDNRYGIVTSETLQRAAEAQCNCDLTPLWETWVQ